jgi:hypothetical protein
LIRRGVNINNAIKLRKKINCEIPYSVPIPLINAYIIEKPKAAKTA